MKTDLTEKFNEYFELVPADTQELKRQVYHLRFLVYCLETGFETLENCPDGLEIDEYDERSDHYLIRHKSSGEFMATTRFILPDPSNIENPFPVEAHCHIDKIELLDGINRHDLAEISRFCVSKKFKKRQGESGTITGVHEGNVNSYSEDERRTFPSITLGLIAALIRMTNKHNVNHWYAVMEPALIRFLANLGIHFTVIGPIAEFHGKRLPCLIDVNYLLSGVRHKNEDLWDLLTDYGKYKGPLQS